MEEVEEAAGFFDTAAPVKRVRSVAERTTIVLSALFLVAISGFGYSLYHLAAAHADKTALATARQYGEVLSKARNLYTDEIVSRALAAGLEISHNSDKRTALPLPSTFTAEIGRRLTAEGNGVAVKLYSDYSFPWRQGAVLDGFERAALAELRKGTVESFARFEVLEDTRVLRYAMADVMGPACVSCHNTHADSPKTDWKRGDVRGALQITVPVPDLLDASPQVIAVGLASTVAVGLGLIGLAFAVSHLRRNSTILHGQAVALVEEVNIRRNAEAAAHMKNLQLHSTNKELEQFAYVASHDLQEPLRKIQAFGDRLESRHGGRLDDEARDFLRRMRMAAARMSVLINDLLAFSRLNSRPSDMQVVALDDVVNGVLSDLEVAIEEAQADISVPEMPAIEADPLQMRQLFQNLIGNALKFRKPDVPVRVEIAAQPVSDSEFGGFDTLWKITVRDNGIGFDPAYAEQIFGVFQRLHAASAYPGSGIGLTICRKIVERHYGRIVANSSPGEGAEFVILIPPRQPAEGKINAD